MKSESYSRGDLSLMAQVPNDVLSFWLKQGVLRPIEQSGGRGHHRAFDRTEVVIAAMLSIARDAGLPIAALGWLAEQARSAAELFRRVDAPSRWSFELCDIVEDPDGDNCRGLVDLGHMTAGEYESLAEKAKMLSPGQVEKYKLGSLFVHSPDSLYAYRSDSGFWNLTRSFGFEDRPDLEQMPKFVILLNLVRVWPFERRFG
ncbi:MAG: helix-turn-helix domain-containing protein [Sphingomonas sp.]|nr:helix-turn-helix domain-containing protein [Sphingomonas sp.]